MTYESGRSYGVKLSSDNLGTIYELPEPFDAAEWNRTAAPEDVFVWKSDDPASTDYGVVVGYTKNVDNYSVLRYPTRCKKIESNWKSLNSTEETEEQIRSYTQNIKKIELPETVDEIAAYAFSGANHGFYFSELEKINIPWNVDEIKEGTFSGCNSLSSIVLEGNVRSIGSSAFYRTGLTDVRIPESVLSIGKSAFSWCKNLESINIPSSVTDMGEKVLEGCESLSSLEIGAIIEKDNLQLGGVQRR